ncbi:MAG TPA: hypothetical protein VK427_24870 [Kofleriaceae bacterium]|nr:hypothetical protein [Kofleriaceae bacterium]
MKRALATLFVVAACGGGGGDDTGDDAPPDQRTFDQCDGDAASFVRSSFLALTGRRPTSTAEVKVYVDMYDATVTAGGDPTDVVARAIMSNPAFVERWVDVVMDALHVQRLDIQSEQSCWDQGLRSSVTPALALAVRDKPALTTADGAPWTMIDLARSAIALDDLTPIYRAQLFSLAAHPLPAANVPPVEAELARREDFGSTFDASYLHRDVVCLACHNSEGAVTDSDDPDRDRHWPVPGAPEKAVYGVAIGVSAERAHAVFRVDDFVNAGQTRPWGWTASCGRFAAPSTVGPDPANVDGKLGSITGTRSTVFDLEAALARGFASLRANGAPTGPIADPDVALAWLVTLKMTEDVWKQVVGSQLTIANYFPRNQASSELLYNLAAKYVTSGFSLKALLVAIVASDYFNRIAPDGACGPVVYSYPAVFDPWVTADADEGRRKNGPGDAVTSIDARTLVSATNAALEWGPPPMATRFADYGEGCETLSCATLQQLCNQGQCCTSNMACKTNALVPSIEVPFQRAVGMFLRNSERGFRGLDFQARLAWEDRYGGCTKPKWVTSDFIDRLVAAGAANPAATVGDVVAALKDRLVGEPVIDFVGSEGAALVATVGPLDAPASTITVDSLRRVCGALLGSPQFTLQGIAGRGGEVPVLTPLSARYDVVCTALAKQGVGVRCTGETLELAPARAPAPLVVPSVPAIAPRHRRADLRRTP